MEAGSALPTVTATGDAMQRFSTFEIDELKLVYRVLHQNLMSHMELMDAEFLEALQSWLQYRASQDGVDVSVHAQWEAWLKGQAPPAPTVKPEGKVIPLTFKLK
jgi:hypothetical protein